MIFPRWRIEAWNRWFNKQDEREGVTYMETPEPQAPPETEPQEGAGEGNDGGESGAEE